MKRTIDAFVFWLDREHMEGEVWYKGELIGTLQGCRGSNPSAPVVFWDGWAWQAPVGTDAAMLEQVCRRGNLDECLTAILGYKLIRPRLISVENLKGSRSAELLFKEHPDFKEKPSS